MSIIVPNYKQIEFLEERLNSIFNQIYQNFEVILLDDLSSDGSNKILQRYEDHPKVVRLILNNENLGSLFKRWKRRYN